MSSSLCNSDNQRWKYAMGSASECSLNSTNFKGSGRGEKNQIDWGTADIFLLKKMPIVAKSVKQKMQRS